MGKKENFNTDKLNLINELNKQNEVLRDTLKSTLDIQEKQKIFSDIELNNRILINEQTKLESEIKANNIKLTKEENDKLKEVGLTQQSITKELKNEFLTRENLVKSIKFVNANLKTGFGFLQQQDKIIRSTVLNLGLSGAKANMMRTSFEESAKHVARLGGSLEDVQTIMQGYADETGRARVLSSDMVKDITLIGKGTGLGIEQATRLGSQFEMIGYNTKATMNYVQGVVETSEKMGINTNKVLKNVNDNFKRLNTYTFQQGVKGIAEMAMYAEKFHMDINQALNAADMSKSLEGAIDLTSQLQIMGGEFAKTDPFEMLFLSRNDPAKFTEKIADMTKGVVTFRKMSDGSFEKFISPADRDRLNAVAKSLGMEAGELTKIAQRQAEIQKMRTEMRGMGLSEEQKTIIEGAAQFNTNTGKFQAMIGGQMKNVTSLGKSEIDILSAQTSSLEERAKNAQTFDEVLKSTINEIKSTLLPILQGINKVLTVVRPIFEGIADLFHSIGPWGTGAGLIAAAGAWKLVVGGFNAGVNKFIERGVGSFSRSTKNIESPKFITNKGGGLNIGAQKAYDVGQVNKMKAGSGLAKAQGLKSLGQGAGAGLASVGAGAGIMLAAEGISKLADSMSKLTPEQAKSLSTIATTLAITFPVAAIGLALVGTTATASAVGLLALGAAVALVGGGIYLATTGIGNMATGIGDLMKNSKGAGGDMIELASGIAVLSASLLGLTFGGLGVATLNNLVDSISSNAPAIAQVGKSFKEINAVMSGNKNDYLEIQKAVESISNTNVKGSGMFTDLANMLKTPLKVEFVNKDINLANNITLELDGQKLMQKTYNVDLAIQRHESLKNGKS